jgi:hypothetical protein
LNAIKNNCYSKTKLTLKSRPAFQDMIHILKREKKTILLENKTVIIYKAYVLIICLRGREGEKKEAFY